VVDVLLDEAMGAVYSLFFTLRVCANVFDKVFLVAFFCAAKSADLMAALGWTCLA